MLTRKPQTRRSRRSVQQRWCSRLSSTAEQHPSSIIYFSYAPFLLSHPLLPHQSFFLLPSHFFFSCFGSIANPLTPTDRSRKSSRRPGDADADAEFGDGDGCYGVEVRGMKGGQVVVVGWGLERKGGRGSEGERLDTKLPKSKTTNPNPIHPPPPPPTSTTHFIPNLPHPKTIPSYQQHTKSESSNRLFAKAKAIPTHKSCTQSPLHPSSIHHLTPTLTSTLFTPSNHPSQNPLFNESKVTETAPSKTIQYTLSLLTIFFTPMLFIYNKNLIIFPDQKNNQPPPPNELLSFHQRRRKSNPTFF